MRTNYNNTPLCIVAGTSWCCRHLAKMVENRVCSRYMQISDNSSSFKLGGCYSSTTICSFVWHNLIRIHTWLGRLSWFELFIRLQSLNHRARLVSSAAHAHLVSPTARVFLFCQSKRTKFFLKKSVLTHRILWKKKKKKDWAALFTYVDVANKYPSQLRDDNWYNF